MAGQPAATRHGDPGRHHAALTLLTWACRVGPRPGGGRTSETSAPSPHEGGQPPTTACEEWSAHWAGRLGSRVGVVRDPRCRPAPTDTGRAVLARADSRLIAPAPPTWEAEHGPERRNLDALMCSVARRDRLDRRGAVPRLPHPTGREASPRGVPDDPGRPRAPCPSADQRSPIDQASGPHPAPPGHPRPTEPPWSRADPRIRQPRPSSSCVGWR